MQAKGLAAVQVLVFCMVLVAPAASAQSVSTPTGLPVFVGISNTGGGTGNQMADCDLLGTACAASASGAADFCAEARGTFEGNIVFKSLGWEATGDVSACGSIAATMVAAGTTSFEIPGVSGGVVGNTVGEATMLAKATAETVDEDGNVDQDVVIARKSCSSSRALKFTGCSAIAQSQVAATACVETAGYSQGSSVLASTSANSDGASAACGGDAIAAVVSIATQEASRRGVPAQSPNSRVVPIGDLPADLRNGLLDGLQGALREDFVPTMEHLRSMGPAGVELAGLLERELDAALANLSDGQVLVTAA